MPERSKWMDERWKATVYSEWRSGEGEDERVDNYCKVTIDRAADIDGREMLNEAVRVADELGMLPDAEASRVTVTLE